MGEILRSLYQAESSELRGFTYLGRGQVTSSRWPFWYFAFACTVT